MSLHGAMLLLAFALGAAVGLSELLSRYSWAVRTIVSSGAGWVYLAINGGAAALGYQAAVDWGLAELSGKPEWWRVLIVSVLSMAFIRSAFATIKVGDQAVGVGLVSVIDIFKQRAERQLDQRLTKQRWQDVGSVVSDLEYEPTKSYFVSVTLTILPSLTAVDRDTIIRETSEIEALVVDTSTKMQLLAMCLQRWLGDKLLSEVALEAARKFDFEIKRERGEREQLRARLSELKKALDT